MNYIDTLVKRDIESGKRGCEWIAINPMWRSSWKKFWRSIIRRHGSQNHHGSSEQEDQADQEGLDARRGSEEDDQECGEESGSLAP